MPTPLSFICVFWGVKYRNYFLDYCLPSMLAPGNLPALTGRAGCKFMIATCQEDWAAVTRSPLFPMLQRCLEVVFIDIGVPARGANLQLHMTRGQKLAARIMLQDRAYGSYLAPDLMLTDGTVRRSLELMDAGKKVILAPALRFETSRLVSHLKQRNLLHPGEPIVFPPRLAGEIAGSCLHSEILRFEWNSPYFCDVPISLFWRVPDSDDIVAHTSSWGIIAASYAEVASYDDRFLDFDTVDSHYIDRVFYPLYTEDEIYFVQDSDEMVFFSITPETDLTFYPLEARPINKVPLVGEQQRVHDLRRFMYSDILDEFRRWAYTKPCHYHGGPITPAARQVAAISKRTVLRASRPPDLVERWVRSGWNFQERLRVNWGRNSWVMFPALTKAAKRLAQSTRQDLPSSSSATPWPHVLRKLARRAFRPVPVAVPEQVAASSTRTMLRADRLPGPLERWSSPGWNPPEPVRWNWGKNSWILFPTVMKAARDLLDMARSWLPSLLPVTPRRILFAKLARRVFCPVPISKRYLGHPPRATGSRHLLTKVTRRIFRPVPALSSGNEKWIVLPMARKAAKYLRATARPRLPLLLAGTPRRLVLEKVARRVFRPVPVPTSRSSRPKP